MGLSISVRHLAPLYSAKIGLSPSAAQFKIYTKEDGTIPFWDDPSCYGGIDRPTNYVPITDPREVISMLKRSQYHEEDMIILSVLRDAFAISEDQLRRLLKPAMNSSTLSNRLRYLAIRGMVDKWKIRSRENPSYKPSAVWSVGYAGFYFLKSQSFDFVIHPNLLIDKGVKGLQRYVSLNEIRTQMFQYQSLKDWRWHGVIARNPTIGKPLGVGVLKGGKGDVCICFERLQQSQRFVQHFSTRILSWERAYVEHNRQLPILDVEEGLPVVIAISCATYDMVEKIKEKVPLANFSIPIWFIVDEWLETKGFPNSIVTMQKGEMTLLPLRFLKLRDEFLKQ